MNSTETSVDTKTSSVVLIAEDDFEMRSLLVWSFIRAGYDVIECHRGAELVKHLSPLLDKNCDNFGIDLVISDIRMPVASGTEVLRAFHDCPGCPPIVMITGFGSTWLHREVMALGAAAVFDKPLDIDVLLDAVWHLLHRNNTGPVATESAYRHQETSEDSAAS